MIRSTYADSGSDLTHAYIVIPRNRRFSVISRLRTKGRGRVCHTIQTV